MVKSDKSVTEWGRKINLFKDNPAESGAGYPPVLSRWVHDVEVGTILRVCSLQSTDSLIDLGAGGGRFALTLAPHVAQVVAVEPSNLFDVLQRNTQGYENIICVRETIQDFVAKQQFTLAIISGVLMYLSDTESEKCLAKAASLLKDDGFLILREPVVRGGLVNINWRYFPYKKNINKNDDDHYEIYRDSAMYTSICAKYRMKKITIQISHAPVFHFLPDKFFLKKYLSGKMQNLLSKPENYQAMDTYNKFAAPVYGFIMNILHKKTMRLHFFQKTPAGA